MWVKKFGHANILLGIYSYRFLLSVLARVMPGCKFLSVTRAPFAPYAGDHRHIENDFSKKNIFFEAFLKKNFINKYFMIDKNGL